MRTLGLVLTVLLLAPQALACCMPLDLVRDYEEADLVLVAEVEASRIDWVEQLADVALQLFGHDGVEARAVSVRPIEVFKATEDLPSTSTPRPGRPSISNPM